VEENKQEPKRTCFGKQKFDFEPNTRVGCHRNHVQYFKYRMLSNCQRLSGGKLGLSATRLSDGKWG